MESMPNPNLEEEARNWLELPEDVISTILVKVGAFEILENAQNVCSLWRKICKDPSIWRVIEMSNLGEMDYDLEEMCKHAVDRSCGGLVEINFECFGSDALLLYISHSSNQLKRLRLVSCTAISDGGLIKAVSELTLLEHLEIYLSSFSPATLEAVGRCRPLLKSFKFNYDRFRDLPYLCDREAFAIAENMPNLHHLQIIANTITDKGLQAILDGCPDLESLDLRLCSNLILYQESGSKCAERIKKQCAGRIGNLRFPDDPVDDYGFTAMNYDGDSFFQEDDDSDDDEDYISWLSDSDFFMDDDYYEFLGRSDFFDYGGYDFY